jgi:5-methylcytosine-specific restriction endonuclease McrA
VDWNHKNNARENRVFLCQSCHSKVHQLGIKVREHLRPGLVEDAWYTMNRRKVLWG